MSSWVVAIRIHWLWLGDYWYYWVLHSLGNSYHPVNIRTAGDIRYLKGCNREVVTRWLSAHLSTTQDRIQAAGFCFTGCVWNFNLPQYNLPASYRFVWTFGEKDPILDGWWSISFIFLVGMAISDPFRYHFPCCAPCYLGAIPTISSTSGLCQVAKVEKALETLRLRLQEGLGTVKRCEVGSFEDTLW